MYINHNNSYYSCGGSGWSSNSFQGRHVPMRWPTRLWQEALPAIHPGQHPRLHLKDDQGSSGIKGCLSKFRHRLQWASDMGQTSPKRCRWAGGSGNALLLDKTLLFVILLAVLFNYISCIPVWLFIYTYDRRKFRSQTSDNMDRWKAEMGKVREEKRRRKKIKKKEKVSEERRSRCAKR